MVIFYGNLVLKVQYELMKLEESSNVGMQNWHSPSGFFLTFKKVVWVF